MQIYDYKKLNRPFTDNYFLLSEFIYAATNLKLYQRGSDRALRSAYITGSRRTSGANHFQYPLIHEKEK